MLVHTNMRASGNEYQCVYVAECVNLHGMPGRNIRLTASIALDPSEDHVKP